MKQFFIYLLKVAFFSALVFCVIVGGLLFFPANVYDDSYQGVIQKKFDLLKETEGKKIIIVGGSNASFGIDEEKIEEATGYTVINLGLHAGFGAIVPTELSKANIQKGDIVILAYEWGWQAPGYFDTFGTDLVISGFDNRLDMYRYIPPKHYTKLIGYLGENAKKKMEYSPATGIYSASSFDSKGRMILDRPETCMVYEGNEETFGFVTVGDGSIAEDSTAYLKEYKEFVEKKGASVYFVSPPVYQGAVVCGLDRFQYLIREEEKNIGIRYLSNPEEYFFPGDCIYDTPYHCTNKGEAKRTELLIGDLQQVLSEK